MKTSRTLTIIAATLLGLASVSACDVIDVVNPQIPAGVENPAAPAPVPGASKCPPGRYTYRVSKTTGDGICIHVVNGRALGGTIVPALP